MLEALILVLLAVVAKDHHTRMKDLGQQARQYGKLADNNSQ